MNLSSNQVLHVAAGAVLQAPTPARGECMNSSTSCPYRVVDSLPSYTGSRDYGTSCRLGPFIGAYKARNVSITGGGVIDGAGKFFWLQFRSMTIERPRLVEVQFVEDLNVGPISLRQAAFWNLHPIYSQRLHIHDISITADSSPNTDGIGTAVCKSLPSSIHVPCCLLIAFDAVSDLLLDPDSCKDVLIENYYYNAGDDAIAVKSGWNYAGYHMNMSSENIYARNCSSNGRGGYTIGSEMSGGVRNVSFVDSTSTGESGIRINSQPGRGGYVTDVTVRNVRFDWKSAKGKSFLFHINQERQCKPGCAGGPKCGFSCDNPNASLATPFSNFVFEDIEMHATASNPIGDFTGGAVPIRNVILKNITIVGPDLKHKGVAMSCINVSGSSSQIVPPQAVCSEMRHEIDD
jgi:polygalacturonase